MKCPVRSVAANSFRLVCGLGLSALAGHVAAAQPVTGFYVAASVGANLVQRENAQRPLPLLDLTAGPAGTFSTGYGFGNGFRFELEGSVRDNNFNHLTGYGPAVAASGDETKYGAMASLAYDINIGLPYIIPYIGGGVGYQWVRWNDLHTAGGPFAVDVNGTGGTFAYQAFAGISIPIRAIPGLAVTAEYRFLGTPERRKYDLTLSGYQPSGEVVIGHGTVHPQEDYNHTFLVGLRYNFDDPDAGSGDVGRPPPVIVPQP